MAIINDTIGNFDSQNEKNREEDKKLIIEKTDALIESINTLREFKKQQNFFRETVYRAGITGKIKSDLDQKLSIDQLNSIEYTSLRAIDLQTSLRATQFQSIFTKNELPSFINDLSKTLEPYRRRYYKNCSQFHPPKIVPLDPKICEAIRTFTSFVGIVNTTKKSNENFLKIKQGPVINDLFSFDPKKTNTAKVDLNGNATLTNPDTKRKISIAGYEGITTPKWISHAAFMVLDYCAMDYAGHGSREIDIVKKYKKTRKLKSTDKARIQLKKAFEELGRIEVYSKDAGERKIIGEKTALIDKFVKGKVTLNEKFCKLLETYPVGFFPKKLLTFNLKHNSCGYYLLRIIYLNKRMNFSKQTNHYGNLQGFKTIIKNIPSLPKYEDIKHKGKIDQRIKSKIENALDDEKAISWHCSDNNEVEINIPRRYKDFANAYIKINEWKELPDYTGIEKGQNKAKKKAENLQAQKDASKKKKESKGKSTTPQTDKQTDKARGNPPPRPPTKSPPNKK